MKAGFEARHDEQKYQSRNFRHHTIADQVVKESLSPIVGNGSWLSPTTSSKWLSAHCHGWREYRRSFDLGLQGFERGLNDFAAQARVKFFG